MGAYQTLTLESVRHYLASTPTLAGRLGGDRDVWTVREVSDGNLNLVFLIDGPTGSVCLKQSLPHVRVDPDWKMPLDRTEFEAAWLRRIERIVPDRVPAFLHFDAEQFVLAMECLTGFVTLRDALHEGADPRPTACQIGQFIAHTAFHTSFLGRPFEDVMPDLALFSRNTTLTRITVDLVLTDPYHDHPRNHWHPALDDAIASMREDQQVLERVAFLQERFLTAPQALLHGDLHIGSIMVRDDDTRVIDGEFSLCGPIGFDCGLFLAHLMLVHAAAEQPARAPIKQAVQMFWQNFSGEFVNLWKTKTMDGEHAAPDILAPAVFASTPDILYATRARFLNTVFEDSVGFAAMEIIRRLIGYAQTSDFDHLSPDTDKPLRQAEALQRACGLLRDSPRDLDALLRRLSD